MVCTCNRKPFRTKDQKVEARASAKKVNGAWRSNAPVSRHPRNPNCPEHGGRR